MEWKDIGIGKGRKEGMKMAKFGTFDHCKNQGRGGQNICLFFVPDVVLNHLYTFGGRRSAAWESRVWSESFVLPVTSTSGTPFLYASLSIVSRQTCCYVVSIGLIFLCRSYSSM